jgi:hypothetical protein
MTGTPDSICRMEWTAFGISHPGGPCGGCLRRVVQGCAHEHLSEGDVCDRHLAAMRGYLPLEEWACGRCMQGEPRHLCVAPVTLNGLS